MAIFSPSESPAITFREVDLTGVVPNVQSTTGAIVGNYRWGPVREATKVATETELAATFATPSSTSAVDFLSAAYFLRYSSSLYVIREATSGAVNANSAGTGSVTVRNKAHFDTLDGTFGTDSGDTNTGAWLARYPGALGNSLKVAICPVGSDSGGTFFSQWTYTTQFDGAPGTSEYAAARSSADDEVHIVVIDEDGLFSGTPGTILERYAFLSLASDAKTNDGSSNYAKDVVNNASRYVYLATFEGTLADLSNAGTAAQGTTYSASATGDIDSSLTVGVDSAALTTSQFATGFALVSDVDTVIVDFLIAPGMASSGDQATVVNNLISIASSTRKDCVVVASPDRAAVVNSATPVTSSISTTDSFTRSSYAVISNNYLKIYDKYNDQYINIPDASSVAGLMAASDLNAAPWFSPAGQRRGALLGVTALAYSATKAERDTLYKAGVNPVANIPGQGVLLFGDKTFLARPSAFDRINVRRLFLTVERAIALAARNVMFEFNDEFTRAEFVNIVEPFLREIQGRRGITDFRVVCDESNNTAAVVDRNEFIANVFIKPARSINYVTLNFVAVRTGVEFDEVVGTV
jgi:phage tail sheath protein FI